MKNKRREAYLCNSEQHEVKSVNAHREQKRYKCVMCLWDGEGEKRMMIKIYLNTA